MYSGNNTSMVNGTGFLVNNRYKTMVKDFRPIDDRMCTLRMKGRFFNITFMCVYAPTEEADEETKDAFYAHLEQEIDCIPKHDIKIILGDLNAKVGHEDAFRETIGKESLHEHSNDNGLRLIDFAIGNAMVIRSTWHQRKNVRKATWRSPDGKTENQIDHVLIDRRHASDILQVDSCRGADCNSDHYLVRIKCRQRIATYRVKRVEKAPQRYDIGKLRTDEAILQNFQSKIKEQLQKEELAWQHGDIEGKWTIIKETLHCSAEEVLGMEKKTPRPGWFDDECRRKLDDRNEARNAW